MIIQSQNIIVMFKKYNKRNVLELNNTNYAKKRRNIEILNAYHNRDVDICVISRDISTCTIRILCVQYNKNAVKNYEDCDKLSEKHKSTSK